MCSTSPLLFNLYSREEEITQRALGETMGLKVNGISINNIQYADDIILFAETIENYRGWLIKQYKISSATKKLMDQRRTSREIQYVQILRNNCQGRYNQYTEEIMLLYGMEY